MSVASLVLGIITTVIGLFFSGDFWHIFGAAVSFLGISFATSAKRNGEEGVWLPQG